MDEVEHTADVRIRSSAEGLPQLFEAAARDMSEYIFGPVPRGRTADEEIAISSPDLQSLLVDWLSELLYRAITSYRALAACDITSFDSNRIVARVSYVPAKALRDVKAVTYSQIRIEQAGERWESEITYDI